jgi:pantoate--beta-alanine ligase
VIEITPVAAMRAWSRSRRAEGRRIGFVPTMGYLHEGHGRLIDRARAASDAVVVSVFVNPTQFGPAEDFARYPRDLDRDRALARDRGTDALFVPHTSDLYPRPGVVTVDPGPLARHLCGPRRPGHFVGVLTVVAKLFHIVEPDVAVFGRKDAQQAQLIRRMVADLDLPVAIDVAPTVREPDRLALSSRNVYLSAAERRAAAAIPQALEHAHRQFVAGATDVSAILATVRADLAEEPALEVEYVEAVDPDMLEPVQTARDDTLLAVAVYAGRTRLIDNVVLGEGLAHDVRLDG